jgi:hypothetical protein
MRLRGSIVAAATILALTGCGQRWDAFVYPDKSNLSFSARMGPYDSLEACRAAANLRLHEFSLQTLPGTVGDYECGLNCDEGSKNGGIAVCKDTQR